MPETDEVTYSDYLLACNRLAAVADGLAEATPDQAIDHWLPRLVQQAALIFSFVGSNGTMRKTQAYLRTVAEMEAAKEGTPPQRRQ